jgi:hypothetical protein
VLRLEDSTTLGVDFATVTVCAALVLLALLASPPYTAVMLWIPPNNVEFFSVALAFVNAIAPSMAVPSLKVTVPVGVCPATVAVKVTCEPSATLEGLTTSVVVELLGATVNVVAALVLAELLISPLYTAVTLCVPPNSAEVDICAWPLVMVTALPITAEPSLKVMVPVAVEGETVPVSVMLVPSTNEVLLAARVTPVLALPTVTVTAAELEVL